MLTINVSLYAKARHFDPAIRFVQEKVPRLHKAYDQDMSSILEHVSSLRREITDLRSMNARYSQQGEHSPREESALELRTIRLQEIRYELSKMLNGSNNSAVWWDASLKMDRAA